MRRLGKKAKIRTNHNIKRCPSCKKKYSDKIQEEVKADLYPEVYEETYYEDVKETQVKERKRLSKKAPDEEYEEEKEPEYLTKNEANNVMWSQINKKKIESLMKKEKVRITGDPCHGCVLLTKSAFHGDHKNIRKFKGKYKHSIQYKNQYTNLEIADSIKKFVTDC